MLGSILSSAVGPVIGGLLGGSSNKSDNKASAKAAEAANAFTEHQMKNRHQWEVADLRAAGLNPILSAHSAPSMGSSAKADVYQGSDAMSKGAAAGSSAYQNYLNTKLQKEQIANLQAQSTNQFAQANSAQANADLTKTQNTQKSVWSSAFSAAGAAVDAITKKVQSRWEEFKNLPQTFRDEIRKHNQKGAYKWK